jgi:hypothetical protein
MLAVHTRHTAATLPNGLVVVVGGLGPGVLASAELYDTATGTWSATGALATPRQAHKSVLLPSGEVLVTAGFSGPMEAANRPTARRTSRPRSSSPMRC